MRMHASVLWHSGLRLAAAAAAVGLTCFAFTDRVGADQTNIAYDQLTKFVGGSQPSPQPGTFDADWTNAIATPAPHHGMFGGLMNNVDKAMGAAKMMTTGLATRYYYMNGWERIEMPASGTATIMRPDKHEIINLDLNAKTYTVVDTNATGTGAAPAPAQPEPGNGPTPQPGEPGTGKLDISETVTPLAAMSFDGVQANGFTMDFKMTMSDATGSCKNGSFETKMTDYVSNYPEPTSAPTSSHPKPMMPSMTSMPPNAIPMRGGCRPTPTMHLASSSSGLHIGDRLSMWSLMFFNGDMQGQTPNQMQGQAPGQMQGGGGILNEVGNVRTLGPSDASLFDIPAGFTQAQ